MTSNANTKLSNQFLQQVEALKRELTDDSSRAILRDRLAEKGPAPSPPTVNKTREVDYVGFAKYGYEQSLVSLLG